MDARRERCERRQTGEVPVDFVTKGFTRAVERQRAGELAGRAALGRELELQGRALAIHHGRHCEAIVACATAVERESADAQIEVGPMVSRGPFRFQRHRERPSGDVPEGGALDVDLGSLRESGVPSGEALDAPTRPHRDGHSIQGIVGPCGREKRAIRSQAARPGAQREVDRVARFRCIE